MRTKHSLLFFLFLIVAFSVVGQKSTYYISTSFHEPANEGLRFIYSKDGLKWDTIPGVFLQPNVGLQKVMRDPSITQTPDGVFHLVWTSSWKGDLGFGYASSRDLINWSEERFIEVMKSEPKTVNVWAPEIHFDSALNKLVVVWASCVPNKFPNGFEEPTNNHRLYYITTTDFKTISDTKLLYDPGFSCIDATIVKRKQNEYVMVLKDNTRPNRNIKVAFSKSILGPYSKPSKPITGIYTEGPTVEKLGNKYYIYYDAYQAKKFGALSTNDFITFNDETKNISIPNGHKHGTIIQVSKNVVDKMLERRLFSDVGIVKK